MKNGWLGIALLSVLGCTGPLQDSDADRWSDAGAEVVTDGRTMDIIFRMDTPRGGTKDGYSNDLDQVDTVPDTPLRQCEQGEGCFLDDCDDNDDCQSGWCVQHLGEGVCSQNCQTECPPGWSCQQVAGAEPDLVYVCVSDYANLCRPCHTNADCTSTGSATDACVDYGSNGNFCGGQCDDAQSCPWGFSCKEISTVEGSLLQQCVNDTGECPCTGSSVALGLTTSCQLDNEFGTCTGKRTCTEETLSECDAVVPAQEICDGLDNDCDEDTDEPDLVDGKFIELCDDGNSCTDDKCTGTDGCLNEILASGDCNDDDPCTVADHCEEGSCTGDPVECDDDNPCTDNLCTETGGCEYPPNEAPCDDANPCTLADQCQEGNCTGTGVPCECQVESDCAALEDDNLCNGTLICDTAALPYKCVVNPGTEVTCQEPQGDNAFCLMASCAPDTGECTFVPDHEGFLCDDSDACTVNSQCTDGSCTGGSPVNCNDGNPCTDDSCESAVGCIYADNTALCNDGDICTTVDECSGGNCTGGPALDCNDQDSCTTDVCVPELGCVHTIKSCECDSCAVCICNEQTGETSCQPACDDADACTNDTCNPDTGECLYQQVVCADDNLCTDNSCNPIQGCVTTLNQAFCDDSNLCTIGDHCHLGECISASTLNCTDSNPCTDDSCNPLSGCQFLPNSNDCEDGNPCTSNDQCQNGTCQGGGQLSCDDDNPCTDDGCGYNGKCIHAFNEESCDDDNICTDNDICSAGSCQGTPGLDCNDLDPCTADDCDPTQGCVYSFTNAQCDNNDLCTTNDFCQQGECKPGPAVTCNDGNSCTVDSCEPGIGCVYVGADPEICDGTDNDCDGQIDEDDACPAGTEVSGVLPCQSTWTKAASPYHVTASVIVVQNCELTIEPGVVVKFFVSNKGSDWDHRLYLQIDGKLTAIGTPELPIVLTADKQNPSQSNWGGIYLKSTQTPLLRHVHFYYGGGNSVVNDDSALAVHATAFTLENCVFRHTDDALRYYGGPSLTVTDSTFEHVDRGVFLLGNAGTITVTGNTFTNANTPVYVPSSPTNSMLVSSNLFQGGGKYRCDGSNHPTTITGNIFDGTGIWLLSGCIPAITGNNFQGNAEFFIDLWEFNQNPGSPLTIDASGNWWGEATTAEMTDKGPEANITTIYDYHDDFTQAQVSYAGWLQAPVDNAGP